MIIAHIAGICHNAPSGGARVVADLAAGLKKRHGIGAVVAGEFSRSPALLERLRAADVSVIEEFVPSLLAHPLRAAGALRRIARVLGEAGADAVHAHAHLAGPALLARLAGLPLVVTCHGAPGYVSGGGLRTALSGRAVRRVYRRAAAVTAVSESLARLLEPEMPPGRIAVVHNGCDTDAFAPGRPAETDPLLARLRESGRTVFGTVGRLAAGKRPRGVLDLARLTRGDLPEAAFVFVGSGPLADELAAESARLGLGDRVFFLGFRENVADVYRQLDALLHLAPDEPFGLIFIEAMAAGLPVIGAAGSAVHEIVVPEETGFIRPFGEWEAWTGPLRALTDPDTRRRLGEAGRRRARARFSVEAMCDRYAALYRRVLGPGEGGGGA